MNLDLPKLGKTASVLFLALAMAGCGGSNGVTGGGEPPEMSTPAEQLAAARKAVEEAEAAVETAATAADRAAAYGVLAAAEQQLAEAEAIPGNVLADLRERLADAESDLEDAENLRTAVGAIYAAQMAAADLGADADQDAIDAAMTAVTAARTAVADLGAEDMARLAAQVASADAMVTAAQTRLDNAAMAKAATEAAGTKEAAIAVEAGIAAADDGGPGGADATTDHMIAIERDRMETKVTITVAGAMEDDPKFMQAMDLGGGRTMHVRTMKADDDGNIVEEVVIVSTDIDAPKAVAFAKVPGQVLNADEDGGVVMGDAAVAFDLGDALTSDRDAAVLANIMASDFAAAAGTTVMHAFNAAVDDDDGTPAIDESTAAAKVAGTYNGAMGTYTCSGTQDCTVTVNDKGMLTAASDGWIFTPEPGATSDVPDDDYLRYGFWLKKTTDSDGVLTYNEVETFAFSSVSASGTLAAVTGSATYNGGATGVYVKNVTNSDGKLRSATSGHFEADATLEATFGQVNNDEGEGTIADDLLNTVTGTIHSFKLSGEEYNEWSVTLEGDIADDDFMVYGEANGGGAEGSFSATFHGDVTAVDHDMDVDTLPIAPKPGSVVGEFNANFSNGSVAGAFGARKE